MQSNAHVILAVALAVAGCGDGTAPADDEPIDPSAAASFRGYAAVQDDLYAKFITADSPFELFRYLGYSGEELSRLVGRPDGFGVAYDVRNARPNAMNVLVWRMMLKGFASDLAASCPRSALVPAAEPPIELSARAAPIVRALCAWPNVTDQALGDAWDLTIGYLAPKASRDAFIRYARDLRGLGADAALPPLWLGALLHPSFLLEP
jgi:hypothetical protein